MAVNYLTSVPKLSGRDNYSDWSFAIENVFVLEGLQKCIDGSEEDSVTIAKAKAKLILTIDPQLYIHVKGCKDAKEVWNTLKNMYEDSGVTRKISLLRTLISLRLENCESMESYINQVIETSQKLNRTDFKISDAWVGSLLLAGLTEKYNPMIMAIEHSGIEISMDVIKSKLLDMTDGAKCGNALAMSSHSTKFGRNFNQQNKHRKFDRKDKDVGNDSKMNNITCFKCKKQGHYMSRCPNNNNNSGNNSTSGNKNAFSAVSAVFFSKQFNRDEWFIDSGASVHLTARKDWMVSTQQSNLKEIMIADKRKVPVLQVGEVVINTVVNEETHEVTIKNVHYVPELTTNLLSVSQLIKNGNQVIFWEKGCKILNANGKLIATAQLVDSIYKLNFMVQQNMVAASAVSGETWHRRFGHCNYNDLKLMQDGAVSGLKSLSKISKNMVCEVCCEGKQTRLPFNQSDNKTSEILQLIHADLCGPMEVNSLGGSRYFLLFEDDFSKMTFVYFLKSKDETFEKFKEFKALVENQKNKQIKIFRTDNGGEFCSKEMESFLKRNGIIHQKTNPFSPQQNGVVERMNRTIVEKSRCLLFEAGLEKFLWAEAVNTSVYLRNRQVVSGTNFKTPYEIWMGHKPDISHIRVFGSMAMVHMPKEKRLKWDKKATKTLLVGFSEDVKGYRLYNKEERKIIISRDVVVDEREKNVRIFIDDEHPKQEIVPDSVGDSEQTEDLDFDNENEDSNYIPDRPVSPVSIEVRRSERTPKPKIFDQYVTYMCTENENLTYDPVSIEEALSRSDGEKWKEAVEDELKSFKENEAWEVQEVPNNGTIVKCKWVFKRKVNSAGEVKHRARLVAKGFDQKAGIDYNETFSPVVKHSTLRLLFALAAKLDLDFFHLDVKTAFLNGDLKETVFMALPDGLAIENSKNKVLRLKKAIYGLKQSSRSWYEKVDEFLSSLGYKKCRLEPCLYTKMTDTSKSIIALYVDDFFIFSNNDFETNSLKFKLGERFKIKDLGEIKQCLGMRVIRDKEKGIITLDQENYVDELLLKFGMSEGNPISSPMEKGLNLERENTCSDNIPYQQLIGSLMYLGILTRPDISFAISFLSQFNNCYGETHWKHAKHVLRYLKGTKNFGLKFSKSDSHLEGFVDADWGSDKLDRKSYSGFCFRFSNSLISWESRKQSTVALSSTEAEYMALSDASKEAIYLKNLLNDLVGINEPVLLLNDNKSAHSLTCNNLFNRRSKHIDIRYHFIRDIFSKKLIKIQYLPTDEMVADILTKSLCPKRHDKLVQSLGLISI